MTRPLTPLTEERLNREVPTLVRCWRIVTVDGTRIGYTEHDRDISFGGTTFRAQSGLSGSALEFTSDLAPDNADILGVFDAAIDRDGVRADRFDEATLECWLVDWEVPDARLLLAVGTLGEIERSDSGYTAEFRSLKHRLDQPIGRLYGRTCDAALGDARCGVNLADPLYVGNGSLAVPGDRNLVVLGLDTFDSGWFSGGRLRVTDGPRAGLERAVREHVVEGEQTILRLWQAFPEPLDAGTGLEVLAGCDKRFDTCRSKFANALNFQGFPFMPGDDLLTVYPVEGDNQDGGQR
jgi:uncharacterized phage protein (TIGR02218 family)